MRRFKSFTIDYINRRLYLEFPEDIIHESFHLRFSDKEITNVPLEYMNKFYRYYNSIGISDISLLDDSTYTIKAVEEYLYKQGILPLDTLVGVNNTLFSQWALSQLQNSKIKYKLETKVANNRVLLTKILRRSSTKVTYHFKKGGKVKSVSATRDYFQSPPIIAYAFDFADKDKLYSPISIYKNISQRKMSLHIPWEQISGNRVEIPVLKDVEGRQDRVVLKNY